MFATTLALLVETGCPTRPTLDDVLEEYVRLRNEYTSVGCACPETIGGGADFQTEQECLDAGSPLDDQDIACMKRVLEGTSHEEAKDIELIECYNEAIPIAIDCKRANLGVCSVTDSNDCASALGHDYDACEIAYSGNNGAQVLEAVEALEALHTCK